MVINILVYIFPFGADFSFPWNTFLSVDSPSLQISIFFIFILGGITMSLSSRMPQILPSVDGCTFLCVAQERTLDFHICLFNFVSLMLVNWYIMSAFCVYWAHTFSFFYWPFSIFKCSVYDYVYNPSVFCITNTFPKSIIYFWVWLWYQIP